MTAVDLLKRGCANSGGFGSEEDRRATTNVQNGLVFFFLFSFINFLIFELKQQ